MAEFFTIYVLPALIILIKSVVLLVLLLIFVAYLLYADRKIWAAVQLRRGPNVVGPWGLLQAFAAAFVKALSIDMLLVFAEALLKIGRQAILKHIHNISRHAVQLLGECFNITGNAFVFRRFFRCVVTPRG